MAGDIILKLKVTANADELKKAMADGSASVEAFANKSVVGFGKANQGLESVSKADKLKNSMADGSASVEAFANKSIVGFGKTHQSLESITKQLEETKSKLLVMAGLGSAFEAGKEIISMADEYKTLEARLHLVTQSSEEFHDVQGKLVTMANANHQSISATTNLYATMEPTLKRAGRSQEDILKAVDSVNKALVVGGSNAVESQQAITQFSQALGEGMLRGQDMNSIMAEGRGITTLLMEALHMTSAQFRKSAEEGKITTAVMVQALIEQNEAVTKKFETMPVTVGQAMQVVKNNILMGIGSADAYTGATKVLSDGLLYLSKNLGGVADAGLLVASIYGARSVGAFASYVSGSVEAAQASNRQAIASKRAAVETATADAESAKSTWAAATAKSRAAVTALELAKANAVVAESELQAAAATESAAVAKAKAQLVDAAASEGRIRASVADKVLELEAAQGTASYGAAVNGLQAAHLRLAAAEAQTAKARLALTAVSEKEAAAAAALHTEAIEAERLATVQLGVAQAEATAAATAETEAKRLAAVAAATATGSTSLMSGAMAMVGGPVGVAAIALAGLVVWLKSVSDEAEKTGKAIKLGTGEWVSYGNLVDQSAQMQKEYITASRHRREEIDLALKKNVELIDSETNVAKANFETAQSKMAGLDKAQFPGLVPNYQLSIDQTKKAFEDLKLDQADIHKSYEDLGKATENAASSTQKSSLELLNAGAATKKAAEENKKQNDSLKTLVETLQKQRIELENGKAAAEYYSARLEHMSDAEARAAGGAKQYNIYLAERKKLQLEHAKIGGGLMDEYRARLDDVGLSSAGDQIDNIKGVTDQAVNAAKDYEKSLEDAKAAGESAGAGISAAMGNAAASTAVASRKMLEDMQDAVKMHPITLQAIQKVSTETGVDPTMMKTMAWIESKFDSDAHNKSSASGVYQFVNKTAKQYDLNGDQKFDPEANTRAYVKLLDDNMAALKKYGIAVNGANLYLAHQQSADGLRQIMDEAAGQGIADDNVRKNMRSNRPDNMKGEGASAFLTAWNEKYSEVEAGIIDVFGGKASQANAKIIQSVEQNASAVVRPLSAVDKLMGKTTAQPLVSTMEKLPSVMDTLLGKTTDVTAQTAKYKGQLDGARVTSAMIAGLMSDHMGNEALALVKTAQDQTFATQNTGYAIRDNILQEKQFNDLQREIILGEESKAVYLTEEKRLREELANVKDPSISGQYARGLSDKTLDKGQIQRLTGQKMELEFTKQTDALALHRQELTLTTDAYRRLILQRDGYSATQINTVMAMEKENVKLGETRKLGEDIGGVFRDGITSSMENMLHTGNTILDQLISKLIESVMTSQALKQTFDSFGGGIASIFSGLIPHASGAAFSSGGVQAYADGGSFHNAVLRSPTYFLANGGLAVAGEAGAEAVMPLGAAGGIRAMLKNPDGGFSEGEYPLTRIGGKLAIQAYAEGDAFGSGVTSQSQTMPANKLWMSGNSTNNINVQPQISIKVVNNGQPANATTKQTQDNNGNIQIEVMLEQIEARHAKGIRTGNGQLADAMQSTYGLKRMAF